VHSVQADAVQPRPGPLRAPAAAAAEVADSFWASLRYFNFYRTALAAIFLLAVLIYGDALNLGSRNLSMFIYTAAAYLAAGVLFHVVLRKWQSWFNAQLTTHVLTDIAALVLLMNASSGIRSGLGVMLLISLAAAALVSRGTLMLFYAAIASIAVLLEQGYWILAEDHSTGSFLQPGLLSIGYFATALITNQLAQRVIMNERLARQRGEDLANHLLINQLVIQDVQDGVMVVDPAGLVRLHNPQVPALLGRGVSGLDEVTRYSEEIAWHLQAWREDRGPSTVLLTILETGKLVRVRFVAAGVGGGSFALVFMEDLSKQHEQAQQLKLAALGRLTANIAHEIRNPLSAITHAGDLLREEPASTTGERLVRIIQDNAFRLDKMVKDILELSRRDRVQHESIGLRAHLGGFLDEFVSIERIPPQGFSLDAPEDARVEFDRAHFHQVLWNLLQNAWRHCRKQLGSVRVTVVRKTNQVELHVIDDGDGVPRDLQSQLFEPFFTTFPSGTGLGLYIARELCAANGATLEYIDRARGADFRIVWQAAP
jgi:two-component system sensor histidine kinase PilS (NtrC family)